MRFLALVCLLLVPGPAVADRACVVWPWSDADPEPALAGLVAWLEPTLGDAPSVAAALEGLAPALCVARRIDGAEGYLDVARREIVLDGGAASGLQRGILLHELRHLDQLARGFCPGNALSLHDAARATYALEADASAVSLMLAWQRRQAGDAAAWEALAGWPQQADIAARFAGAMAAGADLPDAVAAAFAQWYARPDRRQSYYLASCSDYLDREDRGHLPRGTDTLPGDFLTRLCLLPDGGPYPCVEPRFERR